MTVAAIIAAAPTVPCRPWPRHVLSAADWAAMAGAQGSVLCALWADARMVFALFHDAAAGVVLASSEVEAGGFAPLSGARPASGWAERVIGELWGHRGGEGGAWLDHGAWAVATPLAARPVPRAPAPVAAVFEAADFEQDAQLPVGPLAGGWSGAAQWRLWTRGDQVVRAQARLGYGHRGIEGLMRGKSPRAAARFAARADGTATVGHSIAFARAAEAASDAAAPPRAAALRAVMAETERIAGHLGDAAAICTAAGARRAAGALQHHVAALREAAGRAFGHRLMMDVVIPGGVAVDIAADGAEALHATVAALTRAMPALAGAAVEAGGVAYRLEGVGVVPAGLAALHGAGGPVGRASGLGRDVRAAPGYPPYPGLNLTVARREGGDAAARQGLRFDEIRESCRLVRTLLTDLPGGPIMETLPLVSGEGVGWAEGPRGEIWHWLRLEGGQIAACHLGDPGWRHLGLLEAAQVGEDVGDTELVRLSFGLAPAGLDL